MVGAAYPCPEGPSYPCAVCVQHAGLQASVGSGISDPTDPGSPGRGGA